MTFDLISCLHMQIQTWHPPLWLCTHAKYYVKSGLTNVLKNANKTKKYASFFDSDCQLEGAFYREGSPYLARNKRNTFFTPEHPKKIIQGLLLTVPWVGLQCVIVVFPDHTHLLYYQNACDALTVLLDNIISALLVADLFLFVLRWTLL